MLRNEFSQSYLSAPNDSKNNKDAGVVVDRQWRNTPGQRWRFIDSALRNDDGNCLTVIGNTTSGTSSFLLSARCDPGSRSQMWIRHGLQIVRPFDQQDDRYNVYCVGVDKRSDSLHIVLDMCSTNPRYLWYHWDTNCEYDMVVHGESSINGNGRPLRNECSLQFLGALDDEVKLGPWMNLPGQRWRFVDGHLMNDDGVCLFIGDNNRSLLKKDCAEAKKLLIHSNWAYNKKRQIVSHGGRGYCLTASEFNKTPGIVRSFVNTLSSVFHPVLHPIVVGFSSIEGAGSGDVHIADCKDVPEQKWGGFFTTVTKN